jgi:hypothetical protein
MVNKLPRLCWSVKCLSLARAKRYENVVMMSLDSFMANGFSEQKESDDWIDRVIADDATMMAGLVKRNFKIQY